MCICSFDFYPELSFFLKCRKAGKSYSARRISKKEEEKKVGEGHCQLQLWRRVRWRRTCIFFQPRSVGSFQTCLASEPVDLGAVVIHITASDGSASALSFYYTISMTFAQAFGNLSLWASLPPVLLYYLYISFFEYDNPEGPVTDTTVNKY